MEQPKWFRSDHDLKKGDIVLFLKQESKITSNYQYRIVNSVEIGRDGKIRKAHIMYRNHKEEVNRLTFRYNRSLVTIHPVNGINIIQELGQIAIEVNIEKHKISLLLQ